MKNVSMGHAEHTSTWRIALWNHFSLFVIHHHAPPYHPTYKIQAPPSRCIGMAMDAGQG